MNKSNLLVFFVWIPTILLGQYKGTGSVTKGRAKTIVNNLLNCTNGRISAIGEIKSDDSLLWTVPAKVHYTDADFPFASDLHNTCIGANYLNYQQALAKLSGSDIVVLDSSGEVFTSYIFADNYFEMYVNGKPVGKDKVPFTQFNSSIIRFKVKRPFTIAMMLVDWEENLGLGSELNGGYAYHPGDGGMVASIFDSQNKIIATTNKDWRVQTFYTSPIKDLSCLAETGNYRYSSICNHDDATDGSQYYGIHWSIPTNWQQSDFVDTVWPFASTYTNAEIGVDNKPAYTNFKDIFDQTNLDAQFIWSTNLILDNLVLCRYRVDNQNLSNNEIKWNQDLIWEFSNPSNGEIQLSRQLYADEHLYITNVLGKTIELNTTSNSKTVQLSNFPNGIYFLTWKNANHAETKKIVLNK